MLISSNNERNDCSTTAKADFYLFSKKLFLLLHTQVIAIQSVAVLTTVCIVALLILANLTQTSRVAINIEPAASPRYTSPKYTSVAHIVESEIMPRVTMSRNQMEYARRDMDSRRRRITRVCETIGRRELHLNAVLTNMIVDTAHNVSWCPIYKAASSMWMTYFVMLKGALTDTTKDLIRRDLVQVSDIVKQKFPRDADLNKTYERVRRTRKFLIVRHPLERLLSAYRDKLEHMRGREYYYKRFGRRITLRYRQPGSVNAKLEPTFTEFLRFIVNEKHFDEHWAPYYLTCEPCAIQYDYVLKFETLDRDQNFFVQDADLSRYLYEKNYPRNINPHGATTREILGEYIKEIPQSLLDKIYKIYENDFELFDYSLP